MGQLLPFLLHEAIREGDGRVAPQTNPTIAVEDLETGQDEICSAEEARMHARTGDPMGEYA